MAAANVGISSFRRREFHLDGGDCPTSELSGVRARKRAFPPLAFILILRIEGQGR